MILGPVARELDHEVEEVDVRGAEASPDGEVGARIAAPRRVGERVILGLERLDIVELCPEVVEASRLFEKANGAPLSAASSVPAVRATHLTASLPVRKTETLFVGRRRERLLRPGRAHLHPLDQ